MGLDIVIYNADNGILGVYELPYNLHTEIFSNTSNWSSFLYLRKIEDYYKTDVQFQKDDLENFVFDLKQILIFLPTYNRAAIENLIRTLSEESVFKIRITGD